MDVREVFSTRAVRIRRNSSLREAAEVVALSGVSDLMVVGPDDEFVGVLSEGDILRAAMPNVEEIESAGGRVEDAYSLFVRAGARLSEERIDPLVITRPITLHPDDHVAKATVVLIDRQIRLLPVVEDGKLRGTLSRADVCRALVGAL